MRHVSCVYYTYNIDYTLILYIIVMLHFCFIMCCYSASHEIYLSSLLQTIQLQKCLETQRDNQSTHHRSNGPLYSNHGGFSGK